MGKMPSWGLKMAWNGFKRAFVYLKTAFLEPFLGAKSGSRPTDTGASSYFIDSDSNGNQASVRPAR